MKINKLGIYKSTKQPMLNFFLQTMKIHIKKILFKTLPLIDAY